MSLDLEVEILFEPMGKPRPRASAFGGHATIHPDPKGEKWEAAFALEAKAKLPPGPIGGPETLFIVDILAFMPRGAELSKVFKRTGEAKYSVAPIMHGDTPDKDNVEKIVLDALSQKRARNSNAKTKKARPVGPWWFHQDSRIVLGQSGKFYTELGGQPRIWLRIREATEALAFEIVQQTFPVLCGEGCPWTAHAKEAK